MSRRGRRSSRRHSSGYSGIRFPSLYGRAGNAISTLMLIISFVTGSIILASIWPRTEEVSATKATQELTVTVATPTEITKPTRITKFQFSKFCGGDPELYVTDSLSGDGIYINEVEQYTEAQMMTALVQVEGKLPVFLQFGWSDSVVRLQTNKPDGGRLDFFESLNYDPRGQYIALRFEDSVEVLVFLVPFAGPIAYGISKVNETLESQSECPK